MTQSLVPLHRPPGHFFAIQLKETDFKQTINVEDTSEIIFKWDSIVDSILQPKNDLTIKIAQSKPDYNINQIKVLTKAITQTKDIQPMDRIFASDHQKIERIGFVAAKEISDKTTVKLWVNWIGQSSLDDKVVPFFQDNQEIQTLNGRELNFIEKQFGTRLQEIYDLMPVVQENWKEEKYISEFNKLSPFFPKEEQGGKITLFYGTNRNALDQRDQKQIYGTEISELQFGLCEVSIPKGHIQGELERPSRIIIWDLPENDARHITVKKILPIERTVFLTEFSNTLNQAPEKNALLFVHGYNNSFEDAARRTAQLAWDLPFDGFTGFFSWPSGGRTADYLSDEAKARSSFPALEQFLKELMQETNLEHIHIIAHSMGTLVTTLSLNSLRRDGLMSQHLSKIHQLILGASDIDQDEFRNTILPEFKNIGLRRTLYTSDHDFALGISSFGRRGRLRLGQIGEGIFLDKDIDTIEASNIDSPNSHGYIFESKLLLTDLFFLLTQNLNPAQRRLREIRKNLMPYWLFLE